MGHKLLRSCYQALGFVESPFSLTPDTEYFFPGSRHSEALNHLRFGIASGGLTLLTGEVGLGKTLLCRYVLRNPPEGVRLAYLLNPDQSYGDLLVSIIHDLTGVIHAGQGIGALQRELMQILLQFAGNGERVALLVDEAHRLSTNVLEGLRLLSNLDTEKEKLLCLLFVGQPELERTLNKRMLRPLAQRISVRYRLTPLNLQETRQYILHRIRIGSRRQPPFQPNAAMTALVYLLSRGVPRRINQLCDRALLAAYVTGGPMVSPRMIWKAAKEIGV